MDSLRGVIDDLRLVQNGTNDNALLLSFVHAMQCPDASTPTISDVVHSERKKPSLPFETKLLLDSSTSSSALLITIMCVRSKVFGEDCS